MTRVINFFQQIGFNEEQANAIINLLKISKNLQRDVFFQDLEMLKMHFERPENNDQARKFKEIERSKSDEDEINLENFFNNEIYSDENIRDYLIFATQKLFGRNAFQERNEITKQDWLESNFQDIKKILDELGMTQAKKSAFKDPDYSFIFGAAFGRIYLRCKSLVNEIAAQEISKEHQKYLVCGSRAINLEEISLDDGCKKYQINRKSVDWSSVAGNDEFEKLMEEFEASDLFKNYAQLAIAEEQEAARLLTIGTPNEIKIQRLKGEQVIGEFIATKISNESKIEIQLLEDHVIAEGEIRGTTKTNAQRILDKIFQDQTDKSSDSQSKKILLVFNNPHSQRMCMDFKNAIKENHEKYKLNLDVSYMGEGMENPTMAAISEVPSLVLAKFKNFLIEKEIGQEKLLDPDKFDKIITELQFKNHGSMRIHQAESTPVLPQRELSPQSSTRAVLSKAISCEASSMSN